MDVREYVRNLLLDNSIISLTGDNTVHLIHAENPVEPYVEYLFFDENGDTWEEGKEVSADYYLQVDIFTKGSFVALENAIKDKLNEEEFERSMCGDGYESNTGLYHRAMRFIITM